MSRAKAVLHELEMQHGPNQLRLWRKIADASTQQAARAAHYHEKDYRDVPRRQITRYDHLSGFAHHYSRFHFALAGVEQSSKVVGSLTAVRATQHMMQQAKMARLMQMRQLSRLQHPPKPRRKTNIFGFRRPGGPGPKPRPTPAPHRSPSFSLWDRSISRFFGRPRATPPRKPGTYARPQQKSHTSSSLLSRLFGRRPIPGQPRPTFWQRIVGRPRSRPVAPTPSPYRDAVYIQNPDGSLMLGIPSRPGHHLSEPVGLSDTPTPHSGRKPGKKFSLYDGEAKASPRAAARKTAALTPSGSRKAGKAFALYDGEAKADPAKPQPSQPTPRPTRSSWLSSVGAAASSLFSRSASKRAEPSEQTGRPSLERQELDRPSRRAVARQARHAEPVQPRPRPRPRPRRTRIADRTDSPAIEMQVVSGPGPVEQRRARQPQPASHPEPARPSRKAQPRPRRTRKASRTDSLALELQEVRRPSRSTVRQARHPKPSRRPNPCPAVMLVSARPTHATGRRRDADLAEKEATSRSRTPSRRPTQPSVRLEPPRDGLSATVADIHKLKAKEAEIAAKRAASLERTRDRLAGLTAKQGSTGAGWIRTSMQRRFGTSSHRPGSERHEEPQHGKGSALALHDRL